MNEEDNILFDEAEEEEKAPVAAGRRRVMPEKAARKETFLEKRLKNLPGFSQKTKKYYMLAFGILALSLLDGAVGVFRIIMYFITINRMWLWTSLLYMLVSVVLPFVGWVYSTETNYFYYHDHKKMYFLYAVLHAGLVLVQPLMNFTAATYFPYFQGIKITEVFSKEMVIWLGRLISLILPAAFLLLLIPLIRDTIFSPMFMEEVLAFRLGHIVDERGDSREYAYDCCICENLDDGEKVIEYEKDRFIHKLVIGSSGTGKTSSALLPQIYSDLRQKAKNDDKRFHEFEGLIRDGKAILNLPEDYKKGDTFLDEYIVPLKGYENEYYDICKKYKTCGLVLLAPDDETVNKTRKLCLAWGIKPKVIDPSAFYDEDKADMLDCIYGINPLYVPLDLTVEGENIYVPRVAENLEITLNQASNSGGDTDSFFENVNKHVTSMIAQVTILYYRRVEKRQATFEDFTRHLLNPRTLIRVMSALEKLYGKCSQNRLSEDQVFIPKIKKDRYGNETKEYQPVDKEYYQLAHEKYDEVGSLGCRLSETAFENTFNQIYTDLLNPGEAGMKTNEIADNINKWAYGLRNIASNLIQRPELRKTLSYDRTIDFDETLKNGDVVIVNFCLHLGAQLGTAIGLMVQLALNEAVLRRSYDGPAGCSPCFEIMDELPQLIGDWYNVTISLWRKYSCSFTGAIQSELQFEKNASMRYLKGIAEGSGSILVFGRTSAEEMDKFSRLAGKRVALKEMTNVTETSILSDNPSMSYGTRYQEAEEEIMTGTGIRNRDFLEGTHFGVQNGRVMEARAVKMHFLPEDCNDKKPRDTVDFFELAREYPITSAEEAYLRELSASQSSLAAEVEEKNLSMYREAAGEGDKLKLNVEEISIVKDGPEANISGASAGSDMGSLPDFFE